MFRRVTLLAAVLAVLCLTVAGVAWAKTDFGNDRANTLVGSSSTDHLWGLGGKDTIKGLEGDDFLYGGRGGDKVLGGSGDDEVYGAQGGDDLRGGGDDDYVEGNSGPDILRGSDGDDYLDGRDGIDGNDFVTGGPGTQDYCEADSADEIDFSTCEDVQIGAPVL
jgi:Ca2+-binding RTX toxin-like protein